MGDERLQNPILLLKILMGTGKNFSENYWQLGRALSRRFPSPTPLSPCTILPAGTEKKKKWLNDLSVHCFLAYLTILF
jgi:hypothetical protein